MQAFLEVEGPEGRRRVPLEGDRLSIGRDDSNDVVIPNDATVSRRHALMERLAAGWSIHDLDSLNGTWVNGQPLTGGRPLYPDDEILIGDTLLVYRRDESGA